MMKQESKLEICWRELHKKFTVSLEAHFSSLDINGWLSHFAKKQTIKVYQYEYFGGKIEEVKKFKLYYGNIFMSILTLRIPLIIMAKKLFSKLRNEGYKKSKIYLLGIKLEDEFNALAYARFDRFNQENSIYYSAKAIYKLIKIESAWYINQISTYDDTEETDKLVDHESFWKPNR